MVQVPVGNPIKDPCLVGNFVQNPILVGNPVQDPVLVGNPIQDPILVGNPIQDPILVGNPGPVKLTFRIINCNIIHGGFYCVYTGIRKAIHLFNHWAPAGRLITGSSIP